MCVLHMAGPSQSSLLAARRLDLPTVLHQAHETPAAGLEGVHEAGEGANSNCRRHSLRAQQRVIRCARDRDSSEGWREEVCVSMQHIGVWWKARGTTSKMRVHLQRNPQARWRP